MMDLFQDIRPYRDEEVSGVIASLLTNEDFLGVARSLAAHTEGSGDLFAALSECRTIADFKQHISHRLVGMIAQKTTQTILLSGKSALSEGKPCSLISNHRDIVLDSAFLSSLLFDAGFDLPRIAIGDNLFAFPWIEQVVKLNDSFAVKRNLPMKELLAAADHLSDYVHHCLTLEGKSIWIAQREGRAKDCNDRTQVSVLKMLSRQPSSTLPLIEKIKSLNIVPVSMSYEYDPCDYLKARETSIKKLRQGSYTKQTGEDVANMKQGILGFKGRVHFALGTPINQIITPEWESLPKNQILAEVAEAVDREIHKRYHLYPGNYVACDLLQGGDSFAEMYSRQEKDRFETYIHHRVGLALAVQDHAWQEATEDRLQPVSDLETADSEWAHEIRTALLQQYAYPVLNHREAMAHAL